MGAAAAPKPSTWAVMLLGFAGLGFAFRHSRRKVSFA
jgi:MYXO-CTERM domain-containing protein